MQFIVCQLYLNRAIFKICHRIHAPPLTTPPQTSPLSQAAQRGFQQLHRLVQGLWHPPPPTTRLVLPCQEANQLLIPQSGSLSSEDRFRFRKPGTHTSNQPQVLPTLTPSCLPLTSFPSSRRLAVVAVGIVSWSQGQGLVSHQQPSVSDRSWQVVEWPVEGRAVATDQNHPTPHQPHCP